MASSRKQIVAGVLLRACGRVQIVQREIYMQISIWMCPAGRMKWLAGAILPSILIDAV